ncbi:hypothetical protein [Lysinibacillus fusiformis]|uniref:hypothetical protein n=1 Tax=Lysinibacillus fusiformis TaxID=28031 RepID=UPI003D0152DE
MDAFTDAKFDGNQTGLINKHNPRVVVGDLQLYGKRSTHGSKDMNFVLKTEYNLC